MCKGAPDESVTAFTNSRRFCDLEIPILVNGVGPAHHNTSPSPTFQVTTGDSLAGPYSSIAAAFPESQKAGASISMGSAPRVKGLGTVAPYCFHSATTPSTCAAAKYVRTLGPQNNT